MCPEVTTNNTTNCSVRHAKDSGNLSVASARCFVHLPNFCDLTTRKRRCGICLTFQRASLMNHVLNVVYVGAYKQMCRIAARRVVASMTDNLLPRIDARCKIYSHAVRSKDPPSNLERSIVLHIPRSYPQPTGSGICLRNILPKLFESILRQCRHWLNHGSLFYIANGEYSYALW